MSEEKTPLTINAAKLSWMGPIGAIALNIFGKMVHAGSASQGNADPMLPLVFSVVSGAIVFVSLAAGLFALIDIKKYDPKQIAIPAIAGIVVNVAMIVLAYLV
jgi:cation transporter-like permease